MTTPLSAHAQALLLPFLDMPHWPRFEAELLRAVPVMDTPLSLREGPAVVAALAELEAAGLIETWSPSPEEALLDKPHPKLCLRRYWPEGRIWVRRTTG